MVWLETGGLGTSRKKRNFVSGRVKSSHKRHEGQCPILMASPGSDCGVLVLLTSGVVVMTALCKNEQGGRAGLSGGEKEILMVKNS